MTEPVPTSAKETTAHNVPVLPLRECGRLSPHGHSAVRGPGKIHPGSGCRHAWRQTHHADRPEAGDVDDPKVDDLYRIGTLATILQLLKLPDGTVKVLVEGG